MGVLYSHELYSNLGPCDSECEVLTIRSHSINSFFQIPFEYFMYFMYRLCRSGLGKTGKIAGLDRN